MEGGGVRLKVVDASFSPVSDPNAHLRREDTLPMNEKVFANLIRNKTLGFGTKVKGPYENAMKYALLELGIPATYEIWKLVVQNGKTRVTYLPDFVTNLMYEGKQVIFEPHSMDWGQQYDAAFREKMRTIADGYGERFHIVALRYPSLESGIATENTYAHEVWSMFRIRTTLGEDGKVVVSKRSRRRWKRNVKSKIVSRFIEQGAVVVKDPEGQQELAERLYSALREVG